MQQFTDHLLYNDEKAQSTSSIQLKPLNATLDIVLTRDSHYLPFVLRRHTIYVYW